MAIFPNLFIQTGAVSSSNILFQTGARLSLNPSFNLAIEVHPTIKYLSSLTPLKDFNGFIIGIGLVAQMRFGQDPDTAQSIIRSISFGDISSPPLFAAMQSYYTNHPFTTVTITNTEKHSIKDIEVSFYQAGYMDSSTPAVTIPELRGGESKDVELFASFNQEIFKTEGISPLTGEVIVRYKSKGKPAEQSKSFIYELHDKTAIIWDDDKKVAAFITPADSALRNYTSFIRQSCKDDLVSAYNENLQFAIQLFHALGEIGLIYQVDPTLPFTAVKNNTMVVDSISLPRHTLKRITGDCDDLTVLFCSLLETVGIETGFITVPGHIYPVFNSKIPGRYYNKIYTDRNMTINLDDELWVPVEITMVGKAGFIDAWRKGIDEYRALDTSPDQRGFYITRKAQEVYRPVMLKETDLGLQYGRKEEIVKKFNDDMKLLIDEILKKYLVNAKESGRKEDYNRLGIRYAQFNNYSKAGEAFRRAISLDEAYISPKINLGNLFFLQKDYQKALSALLKALEYLEAEGKEQSKTYFKVLLSISKSYYALGEYDKTKEYFAMASEIDKAATDNLSYLGEKPGKARASAPDDKIWEFFFIDDEDQ